MTDPRPILVTGATGNVGREVVRSLVARGVPVRAAMRTPKAAPGDVPTVALDLAAPRTFDAAVAGARGLFLVRPPAISDVKPTLNALVDRARAAGVEHVVFLSVAGAEDNSLIPHHAVEQHLQRGPGAFTLLRAGFFAQNFSDAYLRDLQEDGRVYVPAATGRVAFVDVRDLAELAALAFETPAHRGQAWHLTGPAAIDFEEAARTLTEELGRPIRYEAASLLGYLLHLRRRHRLPWMQAVVQLVLHRGLRSGGAEQVDPTLARLLGRPARSFRDFVRDHAAVWARGPDLSANPAMT